MQNVSFLSPFICLQNEFKTKTLRDKSDSFNAAQQLVSYAVKGYRYECLCVCVCFVRQVQ